MPRYIKIIVSGLPKTGKTTIANLIADVLVDRGLDVVTEIDEDETSNRADAFALIADSGIEIQIEERDAQVRHAQSARGAPLRRGTRTAVNVKRTRFDRAKPPKSEWFSGLDEEIECSSCTNTFVFTVGEQEFYKQNELDRMPRRCRDCRRASKNGHGQRSYG